MPKKSPTQQQIQREVQRDAYAQPAHSAEQQRTVTVVLALNPLDFQHWCEAHGKNPRDRNYLMATPGTARGLHDAHLEITAYGMWRPDIHQLMTALISMLDAPSVKKLQGMGWGTPRP